MSKFFYLLLLSITISIQGQVGINTLNPEATFEVVGRPDDPNHFDGIIPPRLTGNELAAKKYSAAKKGAVVFVTTPASNLSGQAVALKDAGMYYFDGSVWRSFSEDKQPIEYRIILSFDHKSTADLAAASSWSTPVDYYGNTNNLLTASKYYTVGTKNYGGLQGEVSFTKIQGIVNIRFQIYRSEDSAPITEKAFINIADIYSDIGYIPNQIVLLHSENSLKFFPALLENYSIQIPEDSLSSISKELYTYGEAQGYSRWIKPYLP